MDGSMVQQNSKTVIRAVNTAINASDSIDAGSGDLIRLFTSMPFGYIRAFTRTVVNSLDWIRGIKTPAVFTA
jgi:hypothetical protein